MKKLVFTLLIIPFSLSTHAQLYPPPSCINYDAGTLSVCPPDSVPIYSGGLLGYNIYVNGVYVDFLASTNPSDTVHYVFDPRPDPGINAFCAKVVYQNWISETTCDSALVRYGFSLPFTEDWSSGSFENNHWTADDASWVISQDEGNPPPCAAFQGQSGLTNYMRTLASFPFLADTILHGTLSLDFDLKLNSINSTGEETFFVELWDWTAKQWMPIIATVSNANGSFDWTHKWINLNPYGLGKVFRIRFVVEGANANVIEGWYVDNIQIQRSCYPPSDLETEINEDGQIELNWIPPAGGCGYWYPFPLAHCYGNMYDAIGTGAAAEFDVAARWTPSMLVEYENQTIRSVLFTPNEENCLYSIRIWEGDSANLVYEQSVTDPVIGQWNEIELDSHFPIDITQMLWIGYHVNTNTGYPAGVDAGPALDGYGNMMYWQGQWSTLLEINPELDYNWCIVAYLGPPNPWYCANRIYRSVNNGEYELIDEIPEDYFYLDEGADPSNYNCYLVTDLFVKYSDTCESAYTNESCTLPIGIGEEQSEDGILVYPNPAYDLLTVASSSLIQKIEMMDLMGRPVFYQSPDAENLTLQIGGLSRGVYFIRIYSQSGMITRKVIVSRD